MRPPLVKVPGVDGEMARQRGNGRWNVLGHVKTVGITEFQRLQQHADDDRKHRRGGAQPQCQREYRDRRETRAARDLAECVTQILGQTLESRPPPHVASHFPNQQLVPELPPRVAIRLEWIFAALDPLLRSHPQMPADLFVQFLVPPSAIEPSLPDAHVFTPRSSRVTSARRSRRSSGSSEPARW